MLNLIELNETEISKIGTQIYFLPIHFKFFTGNQIIIIIIVGIMQKTSFKF